MTLGLVAIVVGVVVVALARLAGRRIGVLTPLVLIAAGVLAGLVPALSDVRIEPEWILEGVLPPLLYSSAVSVPSMNFRREFAAISGLSIVLVVGTALVLGAFFQLVLPGVGFAWGAALGAVISPTDAVATSIARRQPISPRVLAILDGESLLNDATALVLLRTAIVAAAASFSFLGALGTFAYSVAVAVAIGLAAGWAALLVRQRIADSTVGTVLSFAVPFVASIPASLLGASGLVAAVVAGLVTGVAAPRRLSPRARLSDSQNWRTVELILEALVFLTMGIAIPGILREVERDHAGIGVAVAVAAAALVIALVVRAVYVALLLIGLARRARSAPTLHENLLDVQRKVERPEEAAKDDPRWATLTERRKERFATRITRSLADLDYFVRQPLGARDGVAVVWAGMRGAVTVAAVQTLPDTAPSRSLLVLVAFAVAALSLVAQGASLGPLVRSLGRRTGGATARPGLDEQRERVMALLYESRAAIEHPEIADDASREERFEAERAYRLTAIEAARSTLLDARDDGTFDADLLAELLADLDADQIALELRGTRAGEG